MYKIISFTKLGFLLEDVASFGIWTFHSVDELVKALLSGVLLDKSFSLLQGANELVNSTIKLG